ncbi:MAG: guanylate kinase [Bacteroidota bacterium]
MNAPRLFVISAPSGCGKTTIVKAILQRHPEFRFSISATTRKKRDDEINGHDYFFLTQQEFQRRIDIGEFAEWEEFFGNRYGTLKSQIEDALHAGTSMIFDIDVKGGLSIKRLYPHDAVTIFIEPPNLEILHRRLALRGTETTRQLQIRLSRVEMELQEGKSFKYHIVNDILEKAIADVDAIIQDSLTKS